MYFDFNRAIDQAFVVDGMESPYEVVWTGHIKSLETRSKVWKNRDLFAPGFTHDKKNYVFTNLVTDSLDLAKTDAASLLDDFLYHLASN